MLASIVLHGSITVRCSCGWFIETAVRPLKEAKEVKCMCGKVYIVHVLTLEEVK